MRPAFPTGEFRSLLRSSRWRESMPQQAQRPRSDCYAAAPTPDSLCPSVASVLQAASLHPSKEPIAVEGTPGHHCGGANSPAHLGARAWTLATPCSPWT
jgi:acetoin utilization deacetylase AcuC-like enzyme